MDRSFPGARPGCDFPTKDAPILLKMETQVNLFWLLAPLCLKRMFPPIKKKK
jgi:hypothetical protein